MTADQFDKTLKICLHLQIASGVARSEAETASSESNSQQTRSAQCKYGGCTISAFSTAVDGEEKISRHEGSPCKVTGGDPMS